MSDLHVKKNVVAKVILPLEQYQQLKAIAAARQVPMTQIMRDAIEAAIEVETKLSQPNVWQKLLSKLKR